MSAPGESACIERVQYSMERKEDVVCTLACSAFYPLGLKVGKNLQHRLVDFRQYATLFVASCLSNYPDRLYSE